MSPDGEFKLFNHAGESDVVIDILGILQPVAEGSQGPEGQPGPRRPGGKEGPESKEGPEGPQGPQGDRGISRWEIVSDVDEGNEITAADRSTSVECPDGKKVLGGGGSVPSIAAVMKASEALGDNGWVVEWRRFDFPSAITVYSICADVATDD
ncbi:MAG: hypothetical protein AAGF73_10735 [Actinomycetota bacterium]